MIRAAKILPLIVFNLVLAGCSSRDLSDNFYTEEPQISDRTKSGELLKSLPAPRQPVALAVYAFEDKTGQQKPNDSYPEYSRAVTQGGGAILNKALYDAGNGNWFTVLEREGLNNLVQERKIIRATRMQYATPDGQQLGDIGPLLYAGLLLEGGIVSYESNIITGGFGARYLGIGGNTEYRRDVVTVALRAVNVQNGQVLLAVNTSKTIFSTALQGSVYKFTSIDRLLEIESGFTLNEPPQFAVRQAIEMAVYSLVVEGAMKGLWDFASPVAGKAAMRDYLQRRDGSTAMMPTRYEQAPPPVVAPAATPATPAPVAPRLPINQQPTQLPQLPAESTLKTDAPTETYNGSADTPKTRSETLEPRNEAVERRRVYRQRGEVYCGPAGCVPAGANAPDTLE